ncbi:MAG: hypothetical protein C0504_18185 [Candidatus Solibacter sp.]|nr:hypothetical protein [Candidatus Solibacter sp.]
MPLSAKKTLDKYLVPTTSKTLDILEAFRSKGDELTLREVTERTNIPHTTAFRILFTLVHRGYISQVASRKYRLNPARRPIKVGMAGLSQSVAVSVSAVQSFTETAKQSGIEVIVLDNQDNGDVAIANARQLANEAVDIAVEFQNNAQAAPAIADIFARAKIPTIALHIPQPGAVYFGPNNYRAGWTAGSALAKFALSEWRGHVDHLLLLDISIGGPTLQARMSGVVAGIRQVLGSFDENRIIRVDGEGDRTVSMKVTEARLARLPAGSRVLISGTSDENALGALDALGRLPTKPAAAIVGHDGSECALAAIAAPDSPFIGTVSFNSHDYGPALVDLIMKILGGRQVDPFVYVRHALIDRKSLPRH